MRTRDIERLVRLNTVSPMVLTKHVVRAMMADGAKSWRPHRQHLVDRRQHRVQRAFGLRRDQGVAHRLYQVAGARSSGRSASPSTRWRPGLSTPTMTEDMDHAEREQVRPPQSARPPRRDRRCRRRGRVPDERQGGQYDRHHADRRRRQHRLKPHFAGLNAPVAASRQAAR